MLRQRSTPSIRIHLFCDVLYIARDAVDPDFPRTAAASASPSPKADVVLSLGLSLWASTIVIVAKRAGYTSLPPPLSVDVRLSFIAPRARGGGGFRWSLSSRISPTSASLWGGTVLTREDPRSTRNPVLQNHFRLHLYSTRSVILEHCHALRIRNIESALALGGRSGNRDSDRDSMFVLA